MDQIKKYVRLAERIILALLLVCAGVYYHLYKVEKETRETVELSAKGLPPGVLAKYVLRNRQLQEMVKNAQGKTVVKTIYVPDEAQVQIVTKEKQSLQAKYDELMGRLLSAKTPAEVVAIQKDLAGVIDKINQSTEVTVKTWGLTSRFGYGLVFSPSVKTIIPFEGGSLNLPLAPALDWKYAYAGRYSGILQINPLFIGPGFTRHIDDWVPQFIHANNLELGVTGGWGWGGGKYLGLYLRNNL